MSSSIIELLPFILIAAFAFISRGNKKKVNSSEPEIEFKDFFEQFKEPEKEVVVNKDKIEPQVIHKIKTANPKQVKNIKEEKIESILPEEINWQHAVVYSELLKPKFDE